MSIKLSTVDGGKYGDRVAPIKGAIYARASKRTGYVDIFIPGAGICETHHFTEFTNNEGQFFSSADSVINYISKYFGITYGGGSTPLPDFKTVNGESIIGFGNIDTFPHIHANKAFLDTITSFKTVGGQSIIGTGDIAIGGGGGNPYVQIFNATSDWGSPSGGYYTIVINHNRGSDIIPTVWSNMSGNFIMVLPDSLEQVSANTINMKVLSSPDMRFSGKIVIR